MEETTTLCPAQQRSLDRLLHALSVGSAFTFYGAPGMGKTKVLREVHRLRGGAFLTIKDFVDAMQGQHPLAMEETFRRIMLDALMAHEVVILDDLHLLSNVVSSYMYPRNELLNAHLAALAMYAAEANKKLIFGNGGCSLE